MADGDMGFFSKLFIFLIIFYLLIGPGYNFMMQEKDAKFTPQIFNPTPFFNDMKIKAADAAGSIGGGFAKAFESDEKKATRIAEQKPLLTKALGEYDNTLTTLKEKLEKLKKDTTNNADVKDQVATTQALYDDLLAKKEAATTAEDPSDGLEILAKTPELVKKFENFEQDTRKKVEILKGVGQNTLKIPTDENDADIEGAKTILDKITTTNKEIEALEEKIKTAKTGAEAETLSKEINSKFGPQNAQRKLLEQKRTDYKTVSAFFGRNWWWVIPLGLVVLFLIANVIKWKVKGKGFIGAHLERRRAASRGPAAGAGGST